MHCQAFLSMIYQKNIKQFSSGHFACFGHPKKDTLANSAGPDQTPHNVASDQGLHCLLTGLSITNRTKVTK